MTSIRSIPYTGNDPNFPRKKVRIIKSPYPDFVGKEGVVLRPSDGGNMYGDEWGIEANGVCRVAFPEFFQEPEQDHTSTWCFQGEWEFNLK